MSRSIITGSAGVGLLLLMSLALVLPALGAPAFLSLPSGGSPVPACDHVLKPAAGGAGPELECDLNATSHFTFDPNQLVVPPGSSVVFRVTDIASFAHTFSLDDIVNDTTMATWVTGPQKVTPNQLYAHLSGHLFTNLSLDPGATNVSAPVDLPSTEGTYYYVCEVPAHFQSGMYGTLKVASASGGTPPSSPPSYTGWIVGLGILAVAVGVVTLILIHRMRAGTARTGTGDAPRPPPGQ